MRSNVYTLDSSRLVYFFSCTHNVISALKMVSSCNIKAHWLLCTAVIMSKISVAAHHNIASAALTLQIKAVLQIWACSPFLSSMLLLQHPPSLYPPSLPPFLSSSLPASLPSSLFFFCFVTAHLRGDGLMLVLSEATLPEHSTLGNMQICPSFFFSRFNN